LSGRTADDRTLDDTARHLYGLPLGEFTAARDTAAKQLRASGNGAAARQVKAFRKPAAGAHLVDLLVRDDEALLAEIDDLGHRLRAAQTDSDARQLRALDQERRSLVGRAVAAARELAGRSGTRATDASLRDVEETVWAAVVDEDALATVRAGTLVRPLSPHGFGSVDLDGASALAVPVDEVAAQRRRRAARTRPAKRTSHPSKDDAADTDADERAREAAEAERRARAEAHEQAAREMVQAEAALSAAERSESESSQALDDGSRRLAELEDELAAAEDAARGLTAQQADRTTALEAAHTARRAAEQTVEQARRRLQDAPAPD
jgi:hypothetical protein